MAEQSGIKAGNGGFQVEVKGETIFKGGVIESTQAAVDSGSNQFDRTGGVTFSDLQNSASYKGSGYSVGGGVGVTGSATSLNGLGVGLGRDQGSASSVTTSGISGIAGNTAVRTGDAPTGLAPIFDASKVQKEVDAQVLITQTFSREAPKAVGDYATGQFNKLKDTDPAEAAKWAEGGVYRVALHTVTGALGGGIGGALGAAASASSANVMNTLQDGMEKALTGAGLSAGLAHGAAQGMATVTAAGLGAAVGGLQGAATASTVDANNRQLHLSESQKLAKAKLGQSPEEQHKLDAAGCALVHCADGVAPGDPQYKRLQALQVEGQKYPDELKRLQDTGEFVYQPYLDPARDALARNGQSVERVKGGIDAVAGAVGTVGGGLLATGGAAGCIATLGITCAAVPMGVAIAVPSNAQMHQGAAALLGLYSSSEGQRVLDSFNPATYPGERDPLLSIGVDAAKLGLAYVGGKYVPAALAKVEGLTETTAVAAATKKLDEVARTTTEAKTLANEMLAEADYAGRIPTRADLQDHLVNAQLSGKQISGGHNMTNFDATLASGGGQIVSKVEIAPGIFEVEYKLPKGKDRDPEIKTVYDPSVYSDAQMTSMASEAAARAQIQFQLTKDPLQYVKVGDVWFFAPIKVDKISGKTIGIQTSYPSLPPKGTL